MAAGSGSWNTTGDDDGTAVDLTDPVASEQPFYSSGPTGEFTLINGGYQPVVSLTVGIWVRDEWVGFLEGEKAGMQRVCGCFGGV